MKAKQLAQLGEFGFINAIRKPAPLRDDVLHGIGDDTAVLKCTARKYLLFTTDMTVEGSHFTRRMPAAAVGRKALARNISDIAAMGGLPTHAVVSVGLPSRLAVGYAKGLYEGIYACAREFGVSVVGGDTVRASKIVVNVALLGDVEKAHLTLRSGARPGDRIFVTGPLGCSFPSGKHLTFTPCVAQARFLVRHFKPHAMIDISDGLAADLGHVLAASGVGARLFTEEIPRTRGANLARALYDGEDFELLFTLPPEKAAALIDWQLHRHAWHFYPVGTIVRRPQTLTLIGSAGRTTTIPGKGFTHF